MRAVAALATMALTLMAVPIGAEAQTWVSLTCNNCHSAPPTVASTVTDGSGSLTLGLNESFMNDIASFRTHVRNAPSGASQMMNISDANSSAMYAYLLNVRNGNIALPTPSFPNTAVGSSSTANLSITISNYRNQSIGYSLGITGDYSVVSHTSSGTGCSPGSVPAGPNSTAGPSQCTVSVTLRFTPTTGGSRSGTFSVTPTSASGLLPSPASTSFTSQAFVQAPTFSAAPNPLPLSTRVGTPQAGTVTVTNTGNANLDLSGFTFSRGEFVRSASSTCTTSTSLAPGNTCSLVVQYTASAAGAQNGTVQVTHNAAGSPSTITLNGTGTQSLVSPSSATVAFGNVQQGTNRTLTQTVGNSGTATLNFTAPLPNAPAALTGANPSNFSVGGCAAAVGAGSSCTLSIVFTPDGLGARSATLTVRSDATNSPLVVSLTGTGVSLPEPTVAGPSSDFPDTVIGQVSAQTRTLTVINTRASPIKYAVAPVADFSIDAESCGAGRTVPANSNCMLTVSFRPLAAGGESHRTGSYAFTFDGLGLDNPDPIAVGVAGNALLPLQQSAPSVNASAVVGSPTTSSVVLTNRASTPFTLAALAFSGAAAGDYALDASNACTPGLALAPSTSCTLVARFAPAASGTRNATLTITHDAAGSPQTVQFLGTATPAPQGRIELSASALAFADTQLASTSAQTVTVHNGGNLALAFSGFTFGGANAGDFTRGGSCAVGTPLAIGADCTVTVTFAPTALGTRSASLSIASNASNGTAVIGLSGTGVPIPAPQVTLGPATLDFGTQSIGGLYPARRIRLSNTGTADLAVASVVVSGAGFANVSAAACPSTIAAGAGCDIDIAFTPTAAAPYAGALTVTSNAPGSPHTSALRGMGSVSAVPALVYSPAVGSLDFGAVSVGSVSSVQTVTVLNQGPGGVTLTLLNAIGPDASAFSVVGGSCSLSAPLFEGNTCTVDVRFAPGTSGTKTASVQIASTGSFPPVLSLTGVGLAGPNPNFGLSDTALSFVDTRVGSTSLPAVVRLAASGSGVVTVTAMDVVGPFAVASTTCPALPFTLTAGTECSIAVAFQPNNDGTSTGTLRITTDASPTTREIALSGKAEPKADVTDGGGGGCTIGDGTSPVDPVLWLTVLAALAVLWRRERDRRQRAALRRMRTLRREASL